MGSKNRHAKEIIPILIQNRKENQYFVEPFVGGANIIDKITGNRIGADINPYLIAMWKEVSKGWLPRDNYTEEEYHYIKGNKDETRHLTGYFGFALSYGGKFFGGWRRDKTGKRDYVAEAYRNAIKQFPKLKGVSFECCSYDNLNIPNKSIIYCDPPYRNTTKYTAVDKDFNHRKFFNWCKYMKNNGHEVFVSEYGAPRGFECIWEKEVNSSLTKNTGGKKGTERLFKVI